MLDPVTSTNMLKGTVKVRWTFNNSKHTNFWTGYVVGRVGVMAIVMTIAHEPANHVGASIDKLRAGGMFALEVVFNDSGKAFGCQVEAYIPKSEILLLSVKPGLKNFVPLKFASGDDLDLCNDQKVWTCSHPCGVEWCINRGYIARKRVPNKTIKEYDTKMLMFDYAMGIGLGSSGSAIVNRKGLIVGMQSGQIVDAKSLLSGRPLEDAIKSETQALRKKILSMNLSRLCYTSDDVEKLTTLPCAIKNAVHVLYIEEVLRKEFSHVPNAKELNLNDLIVGHVKMMHYGSSSAGNLLSSLVSLLLGLKLEIYSSLLSLCIWILLRFCCFHESTGVLF